MEICLFLEKLYGKGRRMTTEKEENISEKDKMAQTGGGEWIEGSIKGGSKVRKIQSLPCQRQRKAMIARADLIPKDQEQPH